MSGVTLLVWLAASMVSLLSYWTGRIIERHLPWFHFRPWKWRSSKRRA